MTKDGGISKNISLAEKLLLLGKEHRLTGTSVKQDSVLNGLIMWICFISMSAYSFEYLSFIITTDRAKCMIKILLGAALGSIATIAAQILVIWALIFRAK